MKILTILKKLLVHEFRSKWITHVRDSKLNALLTSGGNKDESDALGTINRWKILTILKTIVKSRIQIKRNYACLIFKINRFLTSRVC